MVLVVNLAANARDVSLIPGYGRSPGEGHGSPLQYSCLENPTDRGTWRPMVHRVAKSWTQLKQLSMQAHTHVEPDVSDSQCLFLLTHYPTSQWDRISLAQRNPHIFSELNQNYICHSNPSVSDLIRTTISCVPDTVYTGLWESSVTFSGILPADQYHIGSLKSVPVGVSVNPEWSNLQIKIPQIRCCIFTSTPLATILLSVAQAMTSDLPWLHLTFILSLGSFR